MKLLPVLCAISLTGLASAPLLTAQDAATPQPAPAEAEKDSGLKVGSPAPALAGGEFIRGDAVKEFEKDKLYILDFWVAGYDPSEASLVHAGALQEKFKDQGVVVISQLVFGQMEAESLEPYLKGFGDKLKSRVALDVPVENSRGAMVDTWMTPAGFTSVPATIVVGKDGRIAWIGSPARLTEEVVSQLLAGTFDHAKFAAETKRLEEEAAALRKTLAPLMPRLQKALTERKWDEASAIADEAEKILPEGRRASVQNLRFDIALGRGDGAAAVKAAVTMSSAPQASGMLLNSLAWRLATTDGLKDVDYEPVEKIAREGLARCATSEKAMIGDTVARVLWLRGKKEEAIKMQEEAVEASSEGMRESLEATLESLRNGELPDASPAD